MIAVDFEDAHGVQLGSTHAAGGGVAPGKTAVVGALSALRAPPDGMQCVVKSVVRFRAA
jgi:hypothetical protein